MKLMKLFLTGVLALSALTPSLSITMEPAQKPTGPATAAEIAHAQTCAICQDDLTNGQDVRTLRCNANGVPHIFHRACINEWLVSQQRTNQPALCPMCQTPAVPEFTLKEQIIAKAGDINYQHNPLSMYNRKLTAYVVGLTAITSMGVALGTPLIAKSLNLTQLPYHKSLAVFTPDYLRSILPPLAFSVTYALLKYCLKAPNDQPANPDQVIAAKTWWVKISAVITATQIAGIILGKYYDKQI